MVGGTNGKCSGWGNEESASCSFQKRIKVPNPCLAASSLFLTSPFGDDRIQFGFFIAEFLPKLYNYPLFSRVGRKEGPLDGLDRVESVDFGYTCLKST